MLPTQPTPIEMGGLVFAPAAPAGGLDADGLVGTALRATHPLRWEGGEEPRERDRQSTDLRVRTVGGRPHSQAARPMRSQRSMISSWR